MPRKQIITERIWRCVEVYLADGCKSMSDAARQVGLCPKNASRFLKWPEIKEKIEAHRKRMAEQTVYTTEIAFKQSQDMMALAVERKQMIAAARFYELGLKLHGFLVDRFETKVALDLRAALTGYQARVLGMDRPLALPGPAVNPFDD